VAHDRPERRQHDDDAVERLVAEGKLLPPRSGSYEVRPPRRVQLPPSSLSANEILEELRGTGE
jgi:hypothetical protein